MSTAVVLMGPAWSAERRGVDDEAVADLRGQRPPMGRNGILGSHLPWGDPRRRWDFVSTGHGDIPWEDAFRALAHIGYDGPICVEWEDAGMDRLHGAAEAVGKIRELLWKRPEASFDAALANQ